MSFRLSRPGPLYRLFANLLLVAVTFLLIQVFLVRLPAYLAAKSAPSAEVAPLAGPDWVTQVEAARPAGTRGAGSGAVGRGIPAAPDPH